MFLSLETGAIVLSQYKGTSSSLLSDLKLSALVSYEDFSLPVSMSMIFVTFFRGSTSTINDIKWYRYMGSFLSLGLSSSKGCKDRKT